MCHEVWQCPKIQRFWQIKRFVNGMWHVDSLIFHCVQSPEVSSDGSTSTAIPAPPHAALLHITLLTAKHCITKLWLSSTTPTVMMVISQIRSYLHMYRLFVERNPESGAKSFFRKWWCFIIHHMPRNKIQQLMLSFRDIRWYLTAQLAGTLGALEV